MGDAVAVLAAGGADDASARVTGRGAAVVLAVVVVVSQRREKCRAGGATVEEADVAVAVRYHGKTEEHVLLLVLRVVETEAAAGRREKWQKEVHRALRCDTAAADAVETTDGRRIIKLRF